MSLLESVVDGTTTTVGALAVVQSLLTLTTSATWSRLRAVARVRPATTPQARRDVLGWLCFALAVTLSGALLLLGVQNVVARLLASAAVTALLVWQVRLIVVSRRHRPSAGYYAPRGMGPTHRALVSGADAQGSESWPAPRDAACGWLAYQPSSVRRASSMPK